jgi:hypothetical protein
MRNIFLFFIYLFLVGCPTYDPPNGIIRIKNSSDETIYVYLTCEETLPKEPVLKLFFRMGNNTFDEDGNSLEGEIFYPNYRIASDSVGNLSVWGKPHHPMIPCDKKVMNLFFITEQVMRNSTWEEIATRQSYQKKMQFTQQQLDRKNWEIEYFP